MGGAAGHPWLIDQSWKSAQDSLPRPESAGEPFKEKAEMHSPHSPRGGRQTREGQRLVRRHRSRRHGLAVPTLGEWEAPSVSLGCSLHPFRPLSAETTHIDACPLWGSAGMHARR